MKKKKTTTKKAKPKLQVKTLKLTCANCDCEISKSVSLNNKGYCNECAFECWGEGEAE